MTEKISCCCGFEGILQVELQNESALDAAGGEDIAFIVRNLVPDMGVLIQIHAADQALVFDSLSLELKRQQY